MTDKESKIHQLGPRKISATGKTFFSCSAGQNGFGNNNTTNMINKPLLPIITVHQPQIRYLLVQHPQFDTLVKELTSLRAKYDQLLIKFDKKYTQESIKANIKQVIDSTHDIQARMSRIVEDSNRMSTSQPNSDQKQNNIKFCSQVGQKQFSKSKHQKQCLSIIQTINNATEKIEQLQQKNIKLSKQFESQRQWKQGIQKENKRLRLMLKNMEVEKQTELQTLRKELNDIKTAKLIEEEKQSENSQELPVKDIAQKIHKTHYLQESRYTNQGEEVSGFSRFSVNGEGSRLSKVYE